MKYKLIALDLDGTLVARDGVISSSDRRALRKAQSRGLHLTLATGRLASHTLPIALELGVRLPVICADGCAMVEVLTGAVLRSLTLDSAVVEALCTRMSRYSISPFLFTSHRIRCLPDATHSAPYVSGWTSAIDTVPRLTCSSVLTDVITLVGVGSEQAVSSATQVLAAADLPARLVAFPLRDARWALRATPRGAGKDHGLAELARLHRFRPEEVVAIGDYHNDIGMLRWAGRSYAMGHAPEPVRAAAHHILRSDDRTGGGIAEAIEHLFSEDRERLHA